MDFKNSPIEALVEPEGSLFSTSAISSHLLDLGYPEKSLSSMLRCGNSTNQFVFMQCSCMSKVIPLKHHCNLRTCPDCSKLRKKRLRRRFFPFMASIHQDRTNFFYFLTISPQNYDNLSDGLKKIRKNFNKFLRLDYVKQRIKGGIYVIEAKKSGGKWNIHIHSIVYGRFLDNRIRGKCLCCGQNLIKFDYISKKHYCSNRRCNSLNVIFSQDSKIVGLWKKSAKEDVNIHISKQGSSAFTLNYMLKYISANKDDFESSFDIANYIVTTRKMKLINTFGDFYNIKIVKVDPICPFCETKITFTFDLELTRIYLMNLQALPDPQQIFSFKN